MELDDRKKKVLQAIVDDYVATNEPVGSKSLIERHDFRVSSATLRNDMAELERLGFIEKPHTSAGRIPSDRGYREYVDSLMKIDTLTPKEQEEIESNISGTVDEAAELIKSATHTLSEATGFVSLSMSPRLRKSFLKQIKILMIEPGKALVVLVLSAGVVKDKVVRIPNFFTDEQMIKLSGAIEKNLTGKALDEITFVTVETAAKDTEIPNPRLKQVLYEAYTAIKQADQLSIYLEGEHKMLAYPDFGSLGRARDLLGTLSDSGMVAGYVNEMENLATSTGKKDSYIYRHIQYGRYGIGQHRSHRPQENGLFESHFEDGFRKEETQRRAQEAHMRYR